MMARSDSDKQDIEDVSGETDVVEPDVSDADDLTEHILSPVVKIQQIGDTVYTWSEHSTQSTKLFWLIHSYFWGHWYPCF